MKICFVVEDIYPVINPSIGDFEVNGRAIHFKHIGDGLLEQGYEVSFVTMDYGQSEVEDVNGFKVYKTYSQNEGLPGLRFITVKIPRILNALKKADADVYFFMCAEALGGIVGWFCKRNNKKFIYCGGVDKDFNGNEWGMNFRDYKLFTYGLNAADLVLCQNTYQSSTLEKHHGRNGVVLYNPMRAASRTYDPEGDIVWIGNYRPQKRAEIYIELSKRVDDRFLMIGGPSGKYPREKYDEINSMATNSNIKILGSRSYDETDKILSRAKLLVNTSGFEGISNTFLQAWRRGIPVVSFVDPDNMIKDNDLGIVGMDMDTMVEAVKKMGAGISEEHSVRIKEYFDKTFETSIIISELDRIVKSVYAGENHVSPPGKMPAEEFDSTATEKKKKKVCFVAEDIYPIINPSIGNFEINGRAVHFKHLSDGLLEQEYDVSFITMDYGQSLSEIINGFKVYKTYRSDEGVPGLRFFSLKVPRVLKALQKADADVYFFMCAEAFAGIIGWFCKRNNKKFIYCGGSDHDFDDNKWGLNFRDLLLFKYGLKSADLVLCQNTYQCTMLEEDYNRKGTVLYNPMKSVKRTYNHEGGIIWVGNYRRLKRPEMFIELSKRIDDRFFMIGGPAGKFPKEEYDRINGTATNGNITILGSKSYEEADDLLSGAKLLVNTSEFEGISNTFLQAWRRGIPVVSFVDPDNMIQDNGLGMVVSDFEGMVEAVRKMSSGISEEHSDGIKEYFDKTFETKIIINKLDKIIEEDLA